MSSSSVQILSLLIIVLQKSIELGCQKSAEDTGSVVFGRRTVFKVKVASVGIWGASPATIRIMRAVRETSKVPRPWRPGHQLSLSKGTDKSSGFCGVFRGPLVFSTGFVTLFQVDIADGSEPFVPAGV